MLAAAVGAPLAGCHGREAAAAADPPAFTRQGDRIVVPAGSPLRTKLVVEPATAETFGANVVAPAVVEADPARQTRILPPLVGRVERLAVSLGQTVKAGQVLAVMASPDLAQATADDERARAQLVLTGKALQRAVGLKAIGGGADKDLQQAQTDDAAARAEAARTASRLRQVGAGRGGGASLTLRAPSGGVVTDLAVSSGAYWNDLTAALMTLTDVSTVWVSANVAEQDIDAIKRGQGGDIAFAALPGQTFKARVLFIGAALDGDTRRAKVRMALPNGDGRLKPGMFATVTFGLPGRPTPAAPTTALILANDQTQVFVEVAPWTFAPHPVETGPEHDGRTAITRGLTVGQRIVTRGGVLLND